MDKTTTNSHNQHGLLIRVTDILLLLACCIIIAARCHINEAFPTGWRISGEVVLFDIGHAEVTAMLVFAGLIFTMALTWLLVRLVKGAVLWKRTSLIIPLAILCLAAIISTWFASNKHTAVIGAANLVSQMVLAVLLVQLLNAPWKQRLLLAVIAATGVVMAYRCAELDHYEIPDLVEMYEQDTEKMLRLNGIEPGTYAAQQFTARIKSRDVGGYFVISNTAAAFFILSIMATLTLMSGRWKNLLNQQKWHYIAGGLLLLLVQIAGLFITQSKGGLGGWAFALLLLGILWATRKLLTRHWKITLAAAVSLVILAILALAVHGIQHNRLPTNSMWVRWQYWQASGKMIADHALTGVGAENFGQYYTRYMNPAAPEVVKDPHCFPIAILSQWGILGLVALLWATLAVSIRLIRPQHNHPLNHRAYSTVEGPKYLWLWGIVVGLGIIVIRAAVSDLSGSLSQGEIRSVILLDFIIPTVIWLGAFWLALLAPAPDIKLGDSSPTTHVKSGGSLGPLILGCALLGFMLHNSIDFAVFQPGLGSLFFATVALSLALRQQENNRSYKQVAQKPSARWALLAVTLVLTLGFWIIIVIPVAVSQRNMAQAQASALKADKLFGAAPPEAMNIFRIRQWSGLIDQAEILSARAAAANPLDPAPHYFQARLSLLRWYRSGSQDKILWENAESAYHEAIRRDPANYRYYRQMSEVYHLAARQNTINKSLYAQKALDYLEQALERYPVKSEMLIEYGKLLMEYGELLEKDNWRQSALNSFEKALLYEQAFQEQILQMYPETMEQISRLQPALQEEARLLIRQMSE